MQNCWDLKGCPASHYIKCPAYERRIDCWEIKQGCLCHVYPNCESCPIFIKHKEELRDKE